MLPSEIIRIPPGSISFTIVFRAAVLFNDHFRAGGNDLCKLGMNKGPVNHMLVIFFLAASLPLAQTVAEPIFSEV
jgi:hypothetical protein